MYKLAIFNTCIKCLSFGYKLIFLWSQPNGVTEKLYQQSVCVFLCISFSTPAVFTGGALNTYALWFTTWCFQWSSSSTFAPCLAPTDGGRLFFGLCSLMVLRLPTCIRYIRSFCWVSMMSVPYCLFKSYFIESSLLYSPVVIVTVTSNMWISTEA